MPARCPICQAAGVQASGPVVLHGHGVRGRQCWGPAEPGGAGIRWTLPQRRYACQSCSTVVVVRPRDHAEEVALFRAQILGPLLCIDVGRRELAAALRELSVRRYRDAITHVTNDIGA